MSEFSKEVEQRLEHTRKDTALCDAASAFMNASIPPKYSYNFSWLGRPIIQYPQDIVAVQELIWIVQPDLIIETGIAHGGSLILSASMLALLDVCDSKQSKPIVPRKVIGLDIDIRQRNREAIEQHPLFSYIEMFEGSSIDSKTVNAVENIAAKYKRIMVFLDSNHTHDHVLAELEAYAPLTSQGSYCVVFDTIVEDLPSDSYSDRPWGKGNNQKTAVHAFLAKNRHFEIDNQIDNKLLISVAPEGYLKRLS